MGGITEITDALGLTDTDGARRAARTGAQGREDAINILEDYFGRSQVYTDPIMSAIFGDMTYGINPEYTALQDEIADWKTNEPVYGYDEEGYYGQTGGMTPKKFSRGLSSLENRLDRTDEEIMTGYAGGGLLGDYLTGLNDGFDPNYALENDPALLAERKYGEQALNRVAGSNRSLRSGGRLYDALDYNHYLTTKSLGTAEDRYNNRMNRLQGMVGLGTSVGSGLASNTINTGANIGGLRTGASDLIATGQLAEGQAGMAIGDWIATALGGSSSTDDEGNTTTGVMSLFGG